MRRCLTSLQSVPPTIFSQTYQYTDGLNRLTSATEAGNGGWSRTFGYDP